MIITLQLHCTVVTDEELQEMDMTVSALHVLCRNVCTWPSITLPNQNKKEKRKKNKKSSCLKV